VDRADAARPAGRDGQAGFTLIELMIVIGIIAILLSVAMPTFLGSRAKAQDAYIDGQSYVTAAAQLASVEPSLNYVTGPEASSSGGGQIAVNPVDDQNVGMSVLAGDGVCWELFDSTASGTTYGSLPHRTNTTCQAPGSPLPAKDW